VGAVSVAGYLTPEGDVGGLATSRRRRPLGGRRALLRASVAVSASAPRHFALAAGAAPGLHSVPGHRSAVVEAASVGRRPLGFDAPGSSCREAMKRGLDSSPSLSTALFTPSPGRDSACARAKAQVTEVGCAKHRSSAVHRRRPEQRSLRPFGHGSQSSPRCRACAPLAALVK